MSKLSRKCCSFRIKQNWSKRSLAQSPALGEPITSPHPCYPVSGHSRQPIEFIFPEQSYSVNQFSLPQMQEHRTEGLRTRKRDPAVWNAHPFWLLFFCCSYGRVLKHKTHQHLLPCKMWHDCFSCDGSLSWLYARCLCSWNWSHPKWVPKPEGDPERWNCEVGIPLK